MRASEADGNTKALGATHRHVGSQLPGGSKEKQSQGIGHENGEGANFFQFLDERAWV